MQDIKEAAEGLLAVNVLKMNQVMGGKNQQKGQLKIISSIHSHDDFWPEQVSELCK